MSTITYKPQRKTFEHEHKLQYPYYVMRPAYNHDIFAKVRSAFDTFDHEPLIGVTDGESFEREEDAITLCNVCNKHYDLGHTVQRVPF